MRAFSPATPPARRPTSVVAFNPASISGLRSRLLDANTFTDPIDSKYYLKDSSTTNTHLPRQGRTWLFDGVNDYATRGARVTSGVVSAMTLSGWVSRTGSSVMMLLTEAGGGLSGWHVHLNSSAGGDIRLYFPDNTSFGVTASGLVSTSALTHFAIVFDGSGSLNADRLKIYINGSLASLSFTGTIPSSIASHANSFDVGAFNSGGGGQFFNRSIRDIRVYNVAKTAGEVSAIYSQSRTGSGTFDSTGLLAAYPCNEESGTTGYDISGNGNHLTLTNITQATFHAANTGVLANRNNAEGYRLSGSVYIPKRLSDSLAADGNALTVTGRAAYHGCAETPCLTGNGSNVYVNLGSVVGVATDFTFWFYLENSIGTQAMVYQDGPSSTLFAIRLSGSQINILARSSAASLVNASTSVVISNYVGAWVKCRVQLTLGASGSVALWLNDSSVSLIGATGDLSGTYSPTITKLMSESMSNYMNGRVANVQITGGVTTYFPLQDGPGSSNTNRDIAWVKSDGTGGVISNAIVNGTVSTIWGNRVPGNVEDWCVKYGGRIATNGAFVAGMLAGGNAADGSAKTLAAGKFGNPFSRLNLNPATAAELNGKNIQTAYEDLPCVTGNGTNLYVDLGSSSFSVVGSTIRCAFFAPSGGSGGNTNKRIASRRNPSLQGWELYFSGGNNLVLFIGDGSGFTEHTLATSIPRDTWMLLDLTVSGSTIGSAITGSVNGVAISTTLPRAILESASNTNLLGSNAMTSYADTRLSGLSVTASGTTTYFPLSDGSGADLAWYKSDGTKGVISTALQGTLTNVWANKTDGSKVAATKYALRAIVTRETEFNRVASDGDDRFLIYDNALSGADLTNVEGYLA